MQHSILYKDAAHAKGCNKPAQLHQPPVSTSLRTLRRLPLCSCSLTSSNTASAQYLPALLAQQLSARCSPHVICIIASHMMQSCSHTGNECFDLSAGSCKHSCAASPDQPPSSCSPAPAFPAPFASVSFASSAAFASRRDACSAAAQSCAAY